LLDFYTFHPENFLLKLKKISPPLAGEDKGEGDELMITPPSPSKGEGPDEI